MQNEACTICAEALQKNADALQTFADALHKIREPFRTAGAADQIMEKRQNCRCFSWKSGILTLFLQWKSGNRTIATHRWTE